MFKNFEEIEERILERNLAKRVVLAGAHDEDALSAVVHAKRKGVIRPILIGDVDKIQALLQNMGENKRDYRIIRGETEQECARLACEMVHQKEADIPMKGLMQTSTFMRAILNKQVGFLKEGDLLSQATVLEWPETNRLLIITDCAVNITPEYKDKIKILNNAVYLANKLGKDNPKVAVIAPVEVINPSIPATIEAAMLSKAAQRGQIKGCIVDGPLGLDNAISMEAAIHKGIKSEVAGAADILIMPELATGNVFTKSLVYFAKLPSAGTLNGTTSPVVMTSRTDTPENKYYSILTAILQSQ